MARGQKRNQPLIQQAGQALERFKYEVAQEIAQNPSDPQAQRLQQYLSGQTGGYGGDIPSRVWGAVGGHMVRRMIAAAEQTLISQAQAAVQQSFRQGLQGTLTGTTQTGFPQGQTGTQTQTI